MGDLGPQPEARIEPGEPSPGGVDAITEPHEDPVVPDLDPDENPATEGDKVPDAVREGEDTATQASEATDESAVDESTE